MGDAVRLYAGTHEGLYVYRPHNGGWTETNRVFENGILDSIAGCQHHPERVFAGVTHDGVYRTADAGARWTKVLDGDVRALMVDPTDDTVVYAGTEPVHLYRSEDGGDSWGEISTLLEMPEDVRAKWWSPVSGVGHVRNIFVHGDDPATIYLALEHGGIVRSFDRGQTWEDVSAGIDYIDIHLVGSLPHRFDRYYVSSARGFFTSDDPGDGWVRAENGFTRDYFHDFIFLPPVAEGEDPTMLIGTADKSPGSWNRPERARSAIFRSDDCARTWYQVTKGLPDVLTAMVSTLITHPVNSNAAFAGLGEVSRGHAHGDAGPGSLMMTGDRGSSWQPLNLQLPADRVLWAAPE
jgi:photosystem II stability/assembly factor-like uncharacterized protein